jgi:hypothetical protein
MHGIHTKLKERDEKKKEEVEADTPLVSQITALWRGKRETGNETHKWPRIRHYSSVHNNEINDVQLPDGRKENYI